ncbi:Ubiquitin carboxyl-terminal hydrolase 48 [Rhizophlyctis rosea]|nr:Ubiquitin carboxyl-terminal hydrolase 48 [Rhizophlyctis rosea]
MDRSNTWFDVDDETVTPMPNVSFEVEETGTKKQKKEKADNGDSQLHTSQSAYMLVYFRRDANRPSIPKPPKEAMDAVDASNNEFEETLKKHNERLDMLRKEFEQKKAERVQVCTQWTVSSDEEFSHYVDAASLIRWLQKDIVKPKDDVQAAEWKTADPMVFDNHGIACKHGRLSPVAVWKAKRISQAAGNCLREQLVYSLAPSLTTNHMCEECVNEVLDSHNKSQDHEQEAAFMKAQVRKGNQEGDRYWLSKTWWNEWKKKTPTFPDGITPSPSHERYRADVFCPHGNLTLDADRSAVEVSEEGYNFLKQSFPDFYTRRHDDAPCLICSRIEEEEHDAAREFRDRAAEEKSRLPRLFQKQPRTKIVEVDNYYLLPGAFLHAWRIFINDPSASTAFDVLDNSPLLCEHGKMVYDVTQEGEGIGEDFILANEEEWTWLSKWCEYRCDNPIRVLLAEDDLEMVGTEPSVCERCRESRLLDWTKTWLFVSKKLPSREQSKEKEDDDDKEDKSEDYMTLRGANGTDRIPRKGKRPAPTETPTPVRQSKRLKGKRDARIIITKEMKLRDFKSEITSQFNIPPYLQRIYVLRNGTELVDNDATMSLARIRKQERILVEEVSKDGDGEYGKGGKEEGFAGTGLMGWHAPKGSHEGNSAGQATDMDVDHIPEKTEETLPLAMGHGADWACGMCTLVNPAEMAQCAACETPKHPHWECGTCTYQNESGAVKCEVCGVGR